MLTRRALLRSLGLGALTLAARPVVRRSPSAFAATPGARPRFYIQIIPTGGMDAIWGTDPKRRRDVDKTVDIGYEPTKIVDTGGARLGPGMAPLAKHMSRLAIVNAFRQNSANHPAGLVHTTCAMNRATPGMPTLLDLLGTRRGTEAVGSISIGAVFGTAMSPHFLGQPAPTSFGKHPGLFDHLDKLDPDDIKSLARVLERRAASAARVSPAESTTAQNIGESAAFLSAVARSPKFVPATWALKLEDYFGNSTDVQRAVWLLENNITRCVTLHLCAQQFDTHVWNYWQPQLIHYLSELLVKLFDNLDTKKVDGRPLSEQTAIFIGSEIGRFPRLNGAKGKDHLPQAPYMFAGPWFRTNTTFGSTDRNMVARPVSLATGKPENGGRELVLDDLGRSLLELDGAKPEVFGYVGERLSFLLA